MGTRRVGAQDSKTRYVLIDATTRIMLEDGYAAVTSRRVATAAGVNSALVHYYFPTLDDLFLAVLQRGAEVNLERQQKALVSDRPLRELWELGMGPFGTALMMEFSALAHHRKVIREVIAGYTERFRELQRTALTFVLRERGIDPGDLPPVLLSVLLSSFSATLVNERALGISSGHEELIQFVEQLLCALDPPATDRGDASSA